MIRRLIRCLVICVTADRWGAGRGDGPCILLVGMLMVGVIVTVVHTTSMPDTVPLYPSIKG